MRVKWLIPALIVAVLIWAFKFVREGFSDPRVKRPVATDRALVSKIEARAPGGVSVQSYVSVLQDYFDTVYTPDPNPPTPQQVDAYLGGKTTLSPADKEALRDLIVQIFYVDLQQTAAQREAQQVQFQPTAALQDSWAAPPISEIAVPGGYATSDPNPVMPGTTRAPTQPMGRGSVEPAYMPTIAEQATGTSYVPTPTGITVSSALAEVKVPAQEIRGPRIPKERGVATSMADGTPADPTQMLPELYGPQGGNGRGGGSSSGTIGALPGGANQVGLDPLALSGSGNAMPMVTLPDSMIKMEPVPFLADFSSFFR